MGTKDFEKDLENMSYGKAIKWGAVFISLFFVLWLVGSFFGLLGAGINAGKGVITKTLDPTNILTTYEGFHDRWKAFEARRSQIHSYRVVVDASSGNQKTTALIELEAMRQSCREIAARYNADSTKTNRLIFKGREAPETLNAGDCDA